MFLKKWRLDLFSLCAMTVNYLQVWLSQLSDQSFQAFPWYSRHFYSTSTSLSAVYICFHISRTWGGQEFIFSLCHEWVRQRGEKKGLKKQLVSVSDTPVAITTAQRYSPVDNRASLRRGNSPALDPHDRGAQFWQLRRMAHTGKSSYCYRQRYLGKTEVLKLRCKGLCKESGGFGLV